MVTEAIDDTAMSAIDASCVLDADSTAGLDSGSAAGPASVPGADSDAVTTNAGFSEVIDHNANILTLGGYKLNRPSLSAAAKAELVAAAFEVRKGKAKSRPAAGIQGPQAA